MNYVNFINGLLNKLSLNVNKTNHMLFTTGRKTYNFSICMDNVPPLKENCTTFLDVYTDGKLSWGDHVKYVSAQTSRGVGIL